MLLDASSALSSANQDVVGPFIGVNHIIFFIESEVCAEEMLHACSMSSKKWRNHQQAPGCVPYGSRILAASEW